VKVDTRNRIEPSLAASAAEELSQEKVLRIIFHQGFFKNAHATFKFSRQPELLYLPYWLGFMQLATIVRCG